MLELQQSFNPRINRVYAVADKNLPQSISSVVTAEARDELHVELSYQIYKLMEAFCDEMADITEERSGIEFSEIDEHIIRCAIWNDILIGQLDSLKECHLDFIANENPHAATELLNVIFDGIEHEYLDSEE